MNVIRCLFGDTLFALKAQDIDHFCSSCNDDFDIFNVQRELAMENQKLDKPVYAILKDGRTALMMDALLDFTQFSTEQIFQMPALLAIQTSPIVDRKVLRSDDGSLTLVLDTHAIITTKEDAHEHFFN